jgi:hypothetical protein
MNPVIILTILGILYVGWCFDRRRAEKRTADLARVEEIEAQWRRMPKRDSRGRFSKK